MKICNWLEDKVFDYVDGLLPNDKKKELENHFKNCPDCRNSYQGVKSVRVQLKKLSPLKTSPDFETVLRTRIKMEKSLKRRGTETWPVRIPLYAATGALIALAAFFVLNNSNRPFYGNQANNPPFLPPSQSIPIQNISQPSSAALGGGSVNIHFPMDQLNLNQRGTPINSVELEKYSTSNSDSIKKISPKTVKHSYEF
ncbi:MAG: anti-sigma factor [bacterium]